MIKFITFKKKNLTTFLSQKSPLNICIGGSMYMETNELLDPQLFQKTMIEKAKCKNRYIMGVNFGPYTSNEYYNEYKKFFSLSNDVCFRDNESFKLFSDLPNVRKAPDIVFSLDTSNIEKKNDKKVIVSVIQLIGDNQLNEQFKQYIFKIKEMISYFYSKGYEIILMSFCDSVGDNITANKIKKELSNIEMSVYSYNGNIKESLDLIASSEIVIASRYHASILGLLFEKKIIPIAYSDKTINALNDINYKGEIIDIRNIKDLDIAKYIKENINYKFDCSIIKDKSNAHFYELDKVLNKGEDYNE